MKFFRNIAIIIATLLTTLSVWAEDISVNITPVQPILPPHVAYYMTNPGQYFNISVQNNTLEAQNIYFGVRLTQLTGTENIDIYVPGSPYLPKTPTVVNASQTKVLNAVEMRQMFNHVPFNAIKMPESMYDNVLSNSFGLLPEGTYELILNVYRWDPYASTPAMLNDPTLSRCTFQVCYNASAPSWIEPLMHGSGNSVYGDMVYSVSALKPMFQWMPPVVNCGITPRAFTYDFKIVEMVQSESPEYLMEYAPTFYEVKNLTVPQCILPYNVTNYFVEGKIYAAQVTVHSNSTQEGSLDYILLENGGKGEIRLFSMTDFSADSNSKTDYSAPVIIHPEASAATSLNKWAILSPDDPVIRWKAPVKSGVSVNTAKFKYDVRIFSFPSSYELSADGAAKIIENENPIYVQSSLPDGTTEFRLPESATKLLNSKSDETFIVEVWAKPDTVAGDWSKFNFAAEGHSTPTIFTYSQTVIRPAQFMTPVQMASIDGLSFARLPRIYKNSPTVTWSSYTIDSGKLPDGVSVTYAIKIVKSTSDYELTVKSAASALNELTPVAMEENLTDCSWSIPKSVFTDGDDQAFFMRVITKLDGPADVIKEMKLTSGGLSEVAAVVLSSTEKPTTYSAPKFIQPTPLSERKSDSDGRIDSQLPMIRWEAPSMTGETDKAVEFTYDLRIVKPTAEHTTDIETVEKAIDNSEVVYERKGISGTRFIIPQDIIAKIDTTKLYPMRVTANPDTTVNGKKYAYDNKGRSLPALGYFSTVDRSGKIEYADTLNNFENPRIVEPTFLDENGCRKTFLYSDIPVSWRKPAYYGGYGAIDADSVKFEYDVEIFAADTYLSRDEMYERGPVHKLEKLTELSDTIRWDDIKEKVTENSYCLVRVVPHAVNDSTTVFTNDEINVVDFAMADLMTRNYYNCESRVSFTNTSPTQKKVDDLKGKTVKVGEYDLVLDGELTAVEGKAGMFKGNGHVPWSPISIKWELEVQFDSLVINTDDRVISGVVETWGGPDNKMSSSECIEKLMSDWGLNNIIADTGIPYADKIQSMVNSEISGLAEQFNIADYYNEITKGWATAKNFTTGGPIGFPMEIPEKYNPSPVSLQIAKMKFTPKYATMDLIGTFVIPDTEVTENQILVFGAPRLCISPESLIPEGGTVALLKDFTVKDPKSDFDFTFKAPSDITTPEDGCFVIWSDGKFAALSADFEMSMPNLKKVVDGEATEDNPKLRLQAKIMKWDNWLAKGHLDSFEAEGAPGFTFGSTDVIIDYSRLENHPQCGSSVFPNDYKWSELGLSSSNSSSSEGSDDAVVNNSINCWTGMYIPSIEMMLPESMSVNGEDRIKMSITNMLVDKSGITMNAGFKDLINYKAGENGTIGGFAFSMDNIYVNVQQNEFRKFAFDGTLQIPLFSGEVKYDCEIAALSVKDNDKNKKGYAYVFRTRQIEDLNFDFFLGNLTLEKALTYFLVEAYDKYTGDKKDETVTNVELCVGGTVDIAGKDKINEYLGKLPFDLKMPGLKFCKMRLANNAGWETQYDDKKLQEARNKRQAEMMNEVGENWWNTDTTYVFGDKNKVYLNWGQWGYASPEKTIGPFTFTLAEYGLDINTGDNNSAVLSFNFGGDITLDAGLGIKGGTSLSICAEITNITDINNIGIKFKEVKFNKIRVNVKNNQLDISGSLELVDTDTRSGYTGTLDVDIMDLFALKGTGGFYKEQRSDGDGSYQWGYFVLTSEKIEIVPVSLYDIVGGFYINARRKSSESDSDYSAEPLEGCNGIILGMGLKMGDGSTFNGKFGATVLINEGKLATLKFTGDVKCAGIIDAGVNFVYENTPVDKYFKFDATVDYSADFGVGGALEGIQNAIGEMQKLNNKFQGYADQLSSGALGNVMGDKSENKASNSKELKDVKGGDDSSTALGKLHIELSLKVTFRKEGVNLKRPDWYVWIGHPDKDKRCYFKFVDFHSDIVTVDIGADAYVCFGSELPNNGQLPPLPEDVADFLDGGTHGASQSDSKSTALKAQGDIKKKFDALSIELGGGVMLGASAWGKIRFDLGLIYGKLGAEAGLDVVAAKLPADAACVNLSNGPGLKGADGSRWYFRGQLYAYLYAKFGLHIYLGFWNGDIDLIDCGIGGVLRCALPNPNYFEGKARIKIKLLGGLVKIDKKFTFECGDYCQMFLGNALDNFELFSYPSIGTMDAEAFIEACANGNPSGAASVDESTGNPYEVEADKASAFVITNADLDTDISIVDPTDLDKVQNTSDITNENGLTSRVSRKFKFIIPNNIVTIYEATSPSQLGKIKTTTINDTTKLKEWIPSTTCKSYSYQIVNQGTKMSLKNFKPTAGKYYCVKMTGISLEYRGGAYVHPEAWDAEAKEYVNKPWSQTRYFFFKAADAKPDSYYEALESLQPVTKLAFPAKYTAEGPQLVVEAAGLGNSYANECKIPAIVADMRAPVISLNGKYKDKMFQKGRLQWEVRSSADDELLDSVPNVWIETSEYSVLTPERELKFNAGTNIKHVLLKHIYEEDALKVDWVQVLNVKRAFGSKAAAQEYAESWIEQKYGDNLNNFQISILGAPNKSQTTSTTLSKNLVSAVAASTTNYNVTIYHRELVPAKRRVENVLYSQYLTGVDDYKMFNKGGIGYYGDMFTGQVLTEIEYPSALVTSYTDSDLLGVLDGNANESVMKYNGIPMVATSPQRYLSFIGNMSMVGGYRIEFSDYNLDITTSESLILDGPMGTYQGKLNKKTNTKQSQIDGGAAKIGNILYATYDQFSNMGMLHPLYMATTDSMASYMYNMPNPTASNAGMHSYFDTHPDDYIDYIDRVSSNVEALSVTWASFLYAITKSSTSTIRNFLNDQADYYDYYAYPYQKDDSKKYHFYFPSYQFGILATSHPDRSCKIESAVEVQYSGMRHERIAGTTVPRWIYNLSKDGSATEIEYKSAKALKLIKSMSFMRYRCNVWNFRLMCWDVYNNTTYPFGVNNTKYCPSTPYVKQYPFGK